MISNRKGREDCATLFAIISPRRDEVTAARLRHQCDYNSVVMEYNICFQQRYII